MGENDHDVEIAVLKLKVENLEGRAKKAEDRWWQVLIAVVVLVMSRVYDIITTGKL